MKKTLIIILFIFSAQTGHAQILIGMKLGFNISSINYNPRFDQLFIKQQFKYGYSGGIIFQYFTEKYLGLQAELLYSEKGFITKFDTINHTQYERDIRYITLPVLAHFYFSKGKASPFLVGGIFGSMALNSKEILTDQNNSSIRDYLFMMKRDNRGEYGLIGGAGFKGNFSFGTLQIEGTYSYSLSSLYKWGYQSNDPDFERYFKIPEQAQNKVIQISLSYMFPLKKTTFKLPDH
jgi:hypothetical protein